MATDRFTSQIAEARVGLSIDLISKLFQLQTSEAEGTFSFRYYAGEQPKDLKTMKHLAGLRQIMSYHRQTWYSYEYSNGQLLVAKIQNVNLGKPPQEIPGSRQEITPQEIPFEDFSEKELIAAGRAIESVSNPTR